MKSVYLTALSPAKGAEGDLKKFQISCTVNFSWHSPLPLLVPLSLWKESFPRDRVDREGLKNLPPLELRGPLIENNNIILKMKDPEKFESSVMFREINGKSVPPREKTSFINWNGLLLNPAAPGNGGKKDASDSYLDKNNETLFQFRSWQLGLYKLRYDEKRNWWEDVSWSCLWKVRKPS